MQKNILIFTQSMLKYKFPKSDYSGKVFKFIRLNPIENSINLKNDLI